MSSTGAGLPLIVLGVALVVTAVALPELGARTRLVLGPGATQSSEFGLVLVDVLGSAEPKVLGAITVIRRPGVGFSVLRAVDDKTCQPVRLSVDKAPGVPAPAALGNYVNLLRRLGGDPYLLTLSSDGQVVVGELHLRR